MTITTKPNLNLDIKTIVDDTIEGVVVIRDTTVIDSLWGSFQKYMEWEDQYRKTTGDWDVYKETGRLINEWLKNIGLEGKVYFYGAEKQDFSMYCAAVDAKEQGYEYCIAENFS